MHFQYAAFRCGQLATCSFERLLLAQALQIRELFCARSFWLRAWIMATSAESEVAPRDRPLIEQLFCES